VFIVTKAKERKRNTKGTPLGKEREKGNTGGE